MNLVRAIRRAEKFTIDNSPLILTVVGVTGTVTTAVLTGKATVKAVRLIDDENEVDPETLTNKDKVKLTWHLYIPAVGVGVTTIACVIGANRIGMRRAAAMAAAYSVSERAFEEYREKIVEKIGESKEREARDDLAQDRVNKKSVSDSQVIVTGGGDVLCFDQYTARYFQSDMETLKKAQNDLNYKILNNFYASLNDFYDKIGITRISHGDEVGWNSDRMVELVFSTTMSDDNRPCIAIDFDVSPVRDYFRTH